MVQADCKQKYEGSIIYIIPFYFEIERYISSQRESVSSSTNLLTLATDGKQKSAYSGGRHVFHHHMTYFKLDFENRFYYSIFFPELPLE
jgi:hypothetical protein